MDEPSSARDLKRRGCPRVVSAAHDHVEQPAEDDRVHAEQPSERVARGGRAEPAQVEEDLKSHREEVVSSHAT